MDRSYLTLFNKVLRNLSLSLTIGFFPRFYPNAIVKKRVRMWLYNV